MAPSGQCAATRCARRSIQQSVRGGRRPDEDGDALGRSFPRRRGRSSLGPTLAPCARRGRLTRAAAHSRLSGMAQRAQERGDAFPRAPTQDEWERMSMEERARVVESLPGEVTWDEMALPEGE